MRTGSAATISRPSAEERLGEPGHDPGQADFGNRAGRLGLEIADINGAIGDLGLLNSEVLKTLAGVMDAVNENSDANRAIAGSIEKTLKLAVEAQASFDQNANEISATLACTVDDVRNLSDGAIEVANSIRQIAQSISGVLKTSTDIQQISLETQMIAINAGVEAARAGEAGRGFTVISQSIKHLADQVRRFSRENTNNLKSLSSVLDGMLSTATRSAERAQSALKAQDAARCSTERIHALVQGVTKLTTSIGEAAESVERNAQSADQVRDFVADLAGTIDKANQQLADTQVRSNAVMDISEGLMLFVVEQGFKTADTHLIEICQQTARRISQIFDNALERHEISIEDLFDDHYEPISGTNPTQFLTRFTRFLDRVLPAIQEHVLSLDERITFCAAVDRNGYLPTHNLVYSKPQGSDPVWNAANCRNRRVFNDRTGLGAGRNTRPFLLQTYRRDMGSNHVLMKDISAPISVAGRHWGGFRMGVKCSGS